MTSVTIPDSVTTIGQQAFYYCDNITRVNISSLESWCNIDFFDVAANPLRTKADLYLNNAKITNLIIPNSRQTIKNYTFYYCNSITSVTIPNSVYSIGDSAFSNCTSLTSVTIPNSVTSIGSYAFRNCDSLTQVNISSLEAWCNIDFADVWANPLNDDNLYLNGVKITNLEIPSTIKEIKPYAFSGCTSLTGVTIPNSVTSIGSSAFKGCTGLTQVNISSLEAWCNIDFVDDIANPLYYGKNLYLNGVKITDLEISSSIKEIKSYAFSGFTSLTGVTIPNSVTSIGSSAFKGCTGLTSVTIPDNVTSIGDSAFNGCSVLTSVTIPNSVTSIGSSAFYGCSGLTSVTFESETPPDVSGNAVFRGCSSLSFIYVPTADAVTSYSNDTYLKSLSVTITTK